MFGIRNMPWLNNVRNAVDSAVHEFTNAADNFADNLRQHQQHHHAHGGPFPSHPAQPPPSSSQRAPVASSRAIRQLPTIRVAPEDLVEPSNRECCICLEENKLGDRVTRLPCAHIFHTECVVDWLSNHSCTCPVCRYELATNDPQYEAGRKERMKTRKPRFALYELQRMSIPQLLALFRTPPRGVCEKAELIQLLIDEDRIHLIRAPKPVEYKLQTLKAMKVSELKRVMGDAGVFFHAKDVVEKSDMITIFINSGRLNLLLEEAADTRMEVEEENSTTIQKDSGSSDNGSSLPLKRPIVETVKDEDNDNDMARDSATPNIHAIDMFGSASEPGAGNHHPGTSTAAEVGFDMQAPDSQDSPQQMHLLQTTESQPMDFETTRDSPPLDNSAHSDIGQEPHSEKALGSEDSDLTSDAKTGDPSEGKTVSAGQPGSGVQPLTTQQDNCHVPPVDEALSCEDPELTSVIWDGNPNDSQAGSAEQPGPVEQPDTEHRDCDSPAREHQCIRQSQIQATRGTNLDEGCSQAVDEPVSQADPVESTQPESTISISIESFNTPQQNDTNGIVPDDEATNRASEVLAEISDPRINDYAREARTVGETDGDSQLKNCSISELQSMCREANIDCTQCCERHELVALLAKAGVAAEELTHSDLTSFSVSQLRALSSVVRIDLSHCHNQREIVDKVLREVNTERRYLRSYLRALSPLAVSSISELRGIARAWGVNISDCLEKEEIINRLIQKGPAGRR